MKLNTVLAIIIVLIFILAFALWVLVTGLSLITGSGAIFLYAFVPGAIVFGFWGLVAWKIYNCPPQ